MSDMQFRLGEENYELILMLKNGVDHPGQNQGVRCVLKDSTGVGTSVGELEDFPSAPSNEVESSNDVVDLCFNIQ